MRFTPNPPSPGTAPRYPPISGRSRRPRPAISASHAVQLRTPLRADDADACPHATPKASSRWYARCIGVAAMVTPSAAGIVASLAVLSSTIVVAVLLLGLVEEGVVASLRRRVARISRRAQGRRVVGVLEPARTDSAASARVA